ncbi:MAG TPA: amidohydrolase family protein [Thermoanaerobaculia bacterium]|nr:amidohydrolase family protein [Thermoanaerobaculia bacterium]
MKKGLMLALLLAGCAARIPTEGTEIGNGRWFNGTGFVPGTWYVVNGTLTRHRPGRIVATIDLKGEYAVPAYGEAHNHNISRPPRPAELQRYIKQGVLYMMNLNNVIEGPDGDRSAQPVDVLYANGGLTGGGGHVVELHEQIIDRGGMKGIRKEDLDGYAFHVIESTEELQAKWPRILAAKPDVIKVYLGFSEEHERRKSSPEHFGKRGLNPALLPEIVRMAHRDRLRVAVHIETARDFEVAVEAGADIIAHLPGWRVGETAGSDLEIGRWLISETAAREAAARGVMIETTALASETLRSGKPEEAALIREIHRRNLETLRKAGVHLVLGSDLYNGTSLAEALFLGAGDNLPGFESLAVMDNLEVLRLLAETTPQAIFPGRKIGKLAEGYEATFLTLSQDPLADLKALSSITRRFKRGVELADTALPGRTG